LKNPLYLFGVDFFIVTPPVKIKYQDIANPGILKRRTGAWPFPKGDAPAANMSETRKVVLVWESRDDTKIKPEKYPA
jgi:hypothetical protein